MRKLLNHLLFPVFVGFMIWHCASKVTEDSFAPPANYGTEAYPPTYPVPDDE